ncbi:MAG TPA: FtsX-like permease family protein [Thermoplasmata archaeon]|nr:FtsX-like permease family protein [Thermoplasmata archaeon]
MASGIVLVIFFLGLIALVSAALALRYRLPFKLAVRNVRRGKGRTVLLILGLLVGTTIVSGSLVIGDTVNAVDVHFTYIALGHVDEGVYNLSPGGGSQPFSYQVATNLQQKLANDSDIAGIIPMIVGTTAVYDKTTGVPQTNLNLIGQNANQTGALGSFTSTSGQSIAGPTAGHVLLDSQAANDINASAGDTVVLFAKKSMPLIVQAVVNDDSRGGFLFYGTAFVDLATAQALENFTPQQINWVAVANTGSIQSAVGLSNGVTTRLNSTLTAMGPLAAGLGAVPVLQLALNSAIQGGSSLSTLFLVLGLFSIVAGAMLIVGIFVMLAEERKGEMGTLRAIGVRRRDLVFAYYFEGLFYSAGSALAGTFLGVLVAYLMTYAFSVDFSGGGVTSSAILASFTVATSSLLIGYFVGFLLTLVTISVAATRVSRLNIVRALRSIPEPPPQLRVYTRLAYVGAALFALGALIYAGTYSGTGDVSLPLIGGILIILGATLLASRFVKNRIAFSAGAVGLLVWGGAEPLHRILLGTQHSGTIFVVFVEGIMLVLGAVMLYSFNAEVVVEGVSRLVGSRPAAVPVVRIGLSYPSRRPFRTAVNLTIFALVLFTIVAVAAFGNSVETNLGQTVRSQSGGYTFFGFSQTPIPSLPSLVRSNSTLAPLFTDVVPIASGAVSLQWSGSGLSAPWQDSLYAAPTNATGSSSFYSTNGFNFSATQGGLGAAQVWNLVATDPNDAVVDHGYSIGGVSFGPTTVHPGMNIGTNVTLRNLSGASLHVTVIGILSESFVGGIFVNPSVGRSLGIIQENTYFLTTANGVDANHAAQAAKRAFFPFGLVLFNFAQILQSSVQSTEAVIGLLEVFVGLGLAVGIAAVGIVALRAVVERRQEIGMLRATGFRKAGILKVFFLEYSYVALLGIGIGTALGVILVWEAATSASGVLSFAIPWLNVAEILGISYLLTVVAITGPALRAARLPPAEAVRYTE